MFKSVYAEELKMYYGLRHKTLSESAVKHEACYLIRFDTYLYNTVKVRGSLSETIINNWVKTINGKSSSVENEVIVIRQFLHYPQLSGIETYIPVIPKVHDDYTPYIFSDIEIGRIFAAADNIIIKDRKADPAIVIEFPVILRLLYSCGLRIGETVKIRISDVDFENGILYMYNTKNKKHRIVPVSAGMKTILQKYCMAYGLWGKNEGWLFPSQLTDSHISDRAIKRRFETVLKSNGHSIAMQEKI